jgi:hypothetical protein
VRVTRRALEDRPYHAGVRFACLHSTHPVSVIALLCDGG